MGPCNSAESESPSAADWGDCPPEMQDNGRQKIGKDGEVCNIDEDNRPESDFFEFEAEEVKEGEQFLSVKPWKAAAAVEPENHPEVNKSKPDETYSLEYVYGYRCQDSRMTVYYNPDGNITYMTAALGIILDKASNTQCFFGGGEVENESKQTASSKEHHSNDIMAMNVNVGGDRSRAVTGQVGKSPAVFVWNTQTGEKIRREALPKNARGVTAIAISSDGDRIATADRSNDHVVTVFDVSSGKRVCDVKGGPDPIWDLTFHRADNNILWSAGVKAVNWFEVNKADKKKGMFGSNPRTSFAAITADDQGCAYAGSAKGNVYVWAGNKVKTIYSFHDPSKGFVGSVMWNNGKLYSGGSDGCIKVVDTSTGEGITSYDFGSLPRAIDVKDNLLLTGLRTGSIVETNMDTGEQCTYMQSHNDGEVWGLDQDACTVWTSGDDNQVIQWDPVERKLKQRGIVNTERRRAKKNKASTLSKHPESQCARCVAVNKVNGDIAVGANDGSVTIRTCDDLNTFKHELRDSREWVEVAGYSPDGNYLAVGSHDTNIYVYDVNNGYNLVGTCKKHNATVTNIDWSCDSTYIRSVCNAYELLFYTIPDCEQDPSGASNTKGTDWASHHCKFGWLVDGIFPKETSGDHINGVDMNEDCTLISTGDDFGLVNLFRNPARKGVKPRSYRGHSEHVVRVAFGRGDLNQWLFSVGGYDQTVMQWKKC